MFVKFANDVRYIACLIWGEHKTVVNLQGFGDYAIQQHSCLIVGRLSVQSRYHNVIGLLLFPQWPVFKFVTIKVQTIGWFYPREEYGDSRRVIAASRGVLGAFVRHCVIIAHYADFSLIIKHSVFDREIISRLQSCHHGLRSVSGTYTTARTGSSEFISFIGQANNGVACLSHVESGAPRMRIDIQKAEHVRVLHEKVWIGREICENSTRYVR